MRKGRFGDFGGQYVPETLMNAVQEEVWPMLYPPEGTDFDLRYQQASDGGIDAWYDRDSGLLVICERER